MSIVKQAVLRGATASGEGLITFGDGFVLAKQWGMTPAHKDGNISMVLGEWIQENRDELIALGNDPADVDSCIQLMRDFTTDPLRNNQ